MTLTDRQWNVWGYKTDKPCGVCGDTSDVRLEPRFNYAACRNHTHLASVESEDDFNSLLDFFKYEKKIPIQFTVDTDNEYIVIHALYEGEVHKTSGWTMLTAMANMKYKLFG